MFYTILGYFLYSWNRPGDQLWNHANDVDEMNNLLEEYQDEHEDPQIIFELLKIKIKEFTINYSKIKSQKNKNDNLELLIKLNDLDKYLSEHPNCPETRKNRDRIKTKLEVMETDKARAAQVRSRAVWAELGEHNNSFFLGLETVRAKAKIMEQVKDENGHILTNQNDIQKRQRQYFANLYKRKIDEDVMANKIDNFMDDCNIPCLSEDQMNRCEAPLTEK